MSRIGKQPILVPSGVELKIDGATVTVKGPKGQLSTELPEPIGIEKEEDGTFAVTGLDARDVGTIAATAGIALYELSAQSASLEEAFMDLTRDAAEYTTTQGAAA